MKLKGMQMKVLAEDIPICPFTLIDLLIPLIPSEARLFNAKAARYIEKKGARHIQVHRPLIIAAFRCLLSDSPSIRHEYGEQCQMITSRMVGI